MRRVKKRGPDIEGREQPELPHFSRSLEATMSRERRKVRNRAVQHNLQPEYKDNAQEAAGKLLPVRGENARRGQGALGSTQDFASKGSGPHIFLALLKM